MTKRDLLDQVIRRITNIREEIKKKADIELNENNSKATNEWFALEGQFIGLTCALNVLLDECIEEINDDH